MGFVFCYSNRSRYLYRTIAQLLYCLQVYKGDEKIKNFIWDLISPVEPGSENKIARNHSGLHNLVPRGRNAKGK